MTDRTFGVGIDLGTSFSAISRADISRGRYEFAEAKDTGGYREIPSLVFVDTDGRPIFGKVAELKQNNPEEAQRVVANFKLLLRANAPILLPGVTDPVHPVELMRGFLAYLKSCYENTLLAPCQHAVVTVPAHEEFDAQYKAMVREAAMGASPLFESIETLAEPDAVLMSLGDLSPFYGQTVLVFDMGGGTLDVSVRDVDEQDGHPFLKQRAVAGSDAAGRKVTEALCHFVLDDWERTQRFTFSKAERATAIRINHVDLDEAKRHLSGLAEQAAAAGDKRHSCKVYLPGRGAGTFTSSVAASTFVRIAEPICDEAIATVEKTLADAGMEPSDIGSYFMVGGSARLPGIKDRLTELFGDRPPIALQGRWGTVDSTLAVARGAAIQDCEREDGSANVPSTKPILERRLPYPIAILVDNRTRADCLIPADSLLPVGPVRRTYHVHQGGDMSVAIELVRGEGDPRDCVPFSPHIVEFLQPQTAGAPFEISWYLDHSGELTVSAFDAEERELGVFTGEFLIQEEHHA